MFVFKSNRPKSNGPGQEEEWREVSNKSESHHPCSTATVLQQQDLCRDHRQQSGNFQPQKHAREPTVSVSIFMRPSVYVRASEYTGIFVLTPENRLKTFNQ